MGVGKKRSDTRSDGHGEVARAVTPNGSRVPDAMGERIDQAEEIFKFAKPARDRRGDDVCVPARARRVRVRSSGPDCPTRGETS